MSGTSPRRTAAARCAAVAMAVIGAGLAGSAVLAEQTPTVLPEVPVTAVDLRQGHERAHNSPGIAVDPTDRQFAAIANRVDVPDFSCGLSVSFDGGRGWLPVQPVPKLPSGAEKCYAPEIAFDAHGLLYYLFVGLHGLGNSPSGSYITTSADHGHTFSAPHQVLGPERYQVRMVLDPAIGDRGRISLVWLEARTPPPLGGLPPGNNPIMSAHSDDGGQTFSTPAQVSDASRLRAVAPALALGPNHDLHVVYFDLGADTRDYQGLEGPTWQQPWSLVATASTDGGQHWSTGVVVDADLVPPERVLLIYTMPPPTLAVDQQGRLFTAWDDARNGDWDVFLRHSTDGGATWSMPLRLNDDRLHDGRHQYMPRLSVAPDGRIDAAFYDRRNDPDNKRNDVFYTYSTDAGVHFAANVRVTSHNSDSTVGARYPIVSAQGLVDFGSRIAVWSDTDRAVLAWTDTRNALPGEQQDIFATEVRLGGTSAFLSGWGLVLLVVLGAAVLVLGGAVLARRLARRPPPGAEARAPS